MRDDLSPTSRSPRPGVQVIARAGSILRAVGPMPTGLSLAELTAATGLPKSTVYRIVMALEAEELVVAADGRYRLGPSLSGGRLSAREELRVRARPHLEQVAARVHETVHLGVVAGDSVLFIDQVRWDHELTAGVTLGGLYPLHSCASGKALLASSEDLARQVLSRPLARATPNTITDPARLRRQLDLIRRDGIAYDEEENRLGISGLATYVTAADGTHLSLGIPMPHVRYGQRRAEMERTLHEVRSSLAAVL